MRVKWKTFFDDGFCANYLSIKKQQKIRFIETTAEKYYNIIIGKLSVVLVSSSVTKISFDTECII